MVRPKAQANESFSCGSKKPSKSLRTRDQKCGPSFSRTRQRLVSPLKWPQKQQRSRWRMCMQVLASQNVSMG
eukprot:symbB.v1.2.028345.t1/scaffold2997.1/size65663/9